MSEDLAPIVLFVYNRLWHTANTLQSLKKNKLAEYSDLIIYSDGPKNDTYLHDITEVRKFLKNVDGFKTIKIVEREKNLGLANSIISGVTEIIQKRGKVIVIEDDLVTSEYFLEYMNDALNIYQDNDRIISVHGYVYPIDDLPDYFFLRGADCWGWATWKRGWDLFETDGKKLLSELKTRNLIKRFDFNNSYPYTKMLIDQVNGKNSSWAIRWYASAFLANKLTLYPGKSFVENIGLDGSGTHCGNNQSSNISLNNYIKLDQKIEIEENVYAVKKFEDFFNSSHRYSKLKSFLFKLRRNN
jgi:hypothetical protein